MRIGFSTIYSWRPHVEHLVWLARLVRRAGHETSFLTCDGDLPTCYTRELRPGTSTFVNCLSCRAGGVRSFEARNVRSIRSMNGVAHPRATEAGSWSKSSASTLGRFESDEEFAGVEFLAMTERLAPASAAAYSAARNWIERDRLDAVCGFNGRMDATRAIAEAARDAGVRYISLERTWFGDGLQLLPDETCLGLKSVDRLMREWRDRPLLREQAARAARHIASRFMRRNHGEWRAYNVEASEQDWPAASEGRRVLILPGSRNEVIGHPDWDDSWPDKLAGYDAVIDRLSLKPAELVLRCHPNWAEKIGGRDGRSSETYYRAWGERRGITVVGASSPASTQGLIRQADAVVVSGSSAALEAGILGKQVIAISPSIYQEGGFQSTAYGPSDVASLELIKDMDARAREAEAAHIMRQTLRFAYTMIYRIPQYVDFVRLETTTRYRYADDAAPQRFLDLARTGVLQPDDGRDAATSEGEDAVLAAIEKQDWQRLLVEPDLHARPSRAVARRLVYRGIDTLRNRIPRGDLWNG